jgi:hypothetical protein
MAALYDARRQKNGSTRANRCWVGMTYRTNGSGNLNITPQFSFVLLTEQLEGVDSALIDSRATALLTDCFNALNALPAPPPPDNFNQWASSCFPGILDRSTGLADPGGDTDRDGLPALVERFLGTNPEVTTFKLGDDPAFHRRPALEPLPDGRVRYTYHIAIDLIDDTTGSYRHTVQSSADGRTWTAHTPVLGPDGPGSFESVHDPTSRDAPVLLLRLAVTEPGSPR